MKLRTALVALIATAAVIAGAQASTLVVSPSMKAQRHGQFTFQYRQTSRDTALDSRYRINYQAVYGVHPGFEVAFTANAGEEVRLGLKYSHLILPEEKIRFAVGATRIGNDTQAYFGAVKDFSDFEIQSGFIDANEGQGFIAFRRFFGPNRELRFTLEHLTGSLGMTGARFDYNFTKNWSFDGRIYFPNDSSSPEPTASELPIQPTC
ncbi:hypothetical protein CCB80_11645 [Armatimonadetes bacterium Uphvl-Ar1]|nr:hypothetical protein CCB80_11645 [Armatimonadetes bacterium Uphvl-Ar1]